MGKSDLNGDMRKFGLELVGNVAWGTHLCQFYETKRDLTDILVPYFVEGLKGNEFCMWVTSPPLEVEEAKKALKKKVPDLDQCVEKGQIEIISNADWYLLGGAFDADRVLQGWVEKEKEALKKGFVGLRLTSNTLWVERKDWESFTHYEASVNAVIGSHRMIALCTYSLKKCEGTSVVDLMRNHAGTLIRRGKAWNLVEDVARRKEAEEHIRALSALPAEDPNPIIRASKEGRILYANSASLSLLATWNREVGQLMPTEWYQRVKESYASNLRNEQEVKINDRTFSFLTVPIKDADYVNIYGRDVTYQKKAENAIRESEERFRMVIENSLDGINLLDLKTGKYVLMSPAQVRLTGFTADEIKGMSAEEAYERTHPDDREITISQQKKVSAGEDITEPVEYRWKVKSGEYRWFSDSRRLVRDEQGQAIALVGISRDVTERKKAEKALRETRDYLDSLLNYANAPIIVWDRQFRITMFNHAFEHLTGFAANDVLGQCLDLLFPPEKKSGAMAHIQRALEGEYWEALEIPILHKDGTIKTALWNSANIHDPTNKAIVATIAQGQDITERKKAEKALRETRDYLDSLLNYANAPIIVWDPEFRITMFNHAFERLSGLSSSEAVGKPLGVLFPKEQKGEAMGHIQRTLAGEQWETVEIPIIHEDGTVRTLLWNSANIYDPNSKKVIATIAQGQDITERKSLEAKLEQYARHLEKLVDEKTRQLQDSEKLATIGQTAGMVGHDIRNPLQSIEGAVYLAKEEIKSLSSQSPEQRELEEILHIIENQTRYIDHIVADLQDFARTPMPQAVETDLGALVKDTLGTARIPKGIKVQTAFQENSRLTIDPVFMRRVITNLIDNAIQAMPNGGKLSLMLTSDQNNTSISVEDTGIGISEKDKPKIYTPLFTTKAKGQGFGLAVCKKLIEAQGGKISFTSEAGKGASFTITFPNKKTS